MEGLTDGKDYILSKAIMINHETNEQEEILLFYDDDGLMVRTEKALEVINKLKKFYEHEETEEFIKENNTALEIINHQSDNIH